VDPKDEATREAASYIVPDLAAAVPLVRALL
jgi:hypothetical protein